MQRFGGRVSGDAVARFLVLEPQHPRAIRFLVHEARERFARIRPPDEALPGARSWARLSALDTRLSTLESLGDVHALLTHVVDEVANICNEIGGELLGYSPRGTQAQGDQ